MSVLAWHFTGDRLRDGSPIPRKKRWLRHEGPLEICKSGLHASRHPFNALHYAPGNILHRVKCDGEIVQDADKLVCSRRMILQSLDVERLLRRFAKDQALSVIHLWDAPQVVVDYLRGDDDSIRTAARAAARDAAWDAARDEFQRRVHGAFGIID